MGGELVVHALQSVVAEHQLQAGGGVGGGLLAARDEFLFVGGEGGLGVAGVVGDGPAELGAVEHGHEVRRRPSNAIRLPTHAPMRRPTPGLDKSRCLA
ncbi:hypothetical protein ACPESV_35195 [Streptomyces umbrinus]|uniref:hypothetical protein n=1 Tax=Streptomyces umbrinus TaxID=67370 RepID=UPI003C2C19DC